MGDDNAKARSRLTLARGFLTTLSGQKPTAAAVANARALLESPDATHIPFALGKARATKADVTAVRRALAATIARLEEFGPPAASLAPAAKGRKPEKGKGGKGGKGDKKGQQGQDSDYNKKHPHVGPGHGDKGGEFAKKGDGMGGEGPSQRVGQLQGRMDDLGYKLQKDGQFGGYTEAAVKKFQSDYGLTPTGKVDAATLTLMREPPPQKLADVQAENAAAAALPNAQGKLPAASASSTASTKAATGKTGTSKTLDTKSRASVEHFQRVHGLKVDGIVGPQTEAAMKDAGVTAKGATSTGTSTSRSPTGKVTDLGTESLQKGLGMGEAADAAVKSLQTIMEALGFSVGEAGVDGRFGPDTEKAVKKLQRRYGLKADGIVGRQTKALLARLEKRRGSVSDTSIQEAPVPSPPPDYAYTNEPGHNVPGQLPRLRIPDRSIKDSRDIPAGAPADLTIKDYRSELERELAETIQARHAAKDGFEYERLLARERILRGRLEEGNIRGISIPWDPTRHPRGRGGLFSEIMKAAQSLGENDKPVKVGPHTFAKVRGGRYAISSPNGTFHADSPSAVADHILGGDPAGLRRQNIERYGKPNAFEGQSSKGRTASELSPGDRVVEPKSGKLLTYKSGPQKRSDGSQVPHTFHDVNGHVIYLGAKQKVVDAPPKADSGQANNVDDGLGHPSLRQHGARVKIAQGPRVGAVGTVDAHGEKSGGTRDDAWSLVRLADGSSTRVPNSHLAPPDADLSRLLGPDNPKLPGAPHPDAVAARAAAARKDAKLPSVSARRRNEAKAVAQTADATDPLEKRLPGMKVHEITGVILSDWKQPNFAAKPYLEAMGSLGSHKESYGQDPGSSILAYFLSNARSWKGDTARAVKKELRRRLKEATVQDAEAKLEEAVAARKAATDGFAFARALAREGILRAQLEEAAALLTTPDPEEYAIAEASLDRWLDADDRALVESIEPEANGALGSLLDALEDFGLIEAADSMVKASTPEPFSKSKTSNWVARVGGLPAYIQHIAHDIAEKRGKTVSNAIAIAIAAVKRWAAGVGNVDSGTRAAARKAVAEWTAKKAANAGKKAAKAAA